MTPIKLNKMKVENSLHNHGGVGIDFWKEENGCDTLLFSLDNEEVIKLAQWLVTYIDKNERDTTGDEKSDKYNADKIIEIWNLAIEEAAKSCCTVCKAAENIRRLKK